jgi:anti-sigma B factor antagonist
MSCSPHHLVAAAPEPTTVVVRLPDEIDITNEREVMEILTCALGDGLAVLVADATATTFCGASGRTALVHGHRQAQAAGTQLRVAASPAVQRVLELTGADQVLNTYRSLTEALNGQHAAADR